MASRAGFPSPDAGISAMESLESMWANGTGLVLQGGACFLENLGDGTYGLSIVAAQECTDQRGAYQSAIDYAFAATDCMRIVTTATDLGGATALEQMGFCLFNTSEVVAVQEPATLYHMGLDLDAWLPAFGPRLFYVEASRLGNSEKAARALERWARYYADPSVLDPDESEGLQGEELRDWFAEELEKRREIAAPYFGEDEISNWTLEHTPDCSHQLLRLDCPCGLKEVFLSSRQVVLVGQHGDVQSATLQ